MKEVMLKSIKHNTITTVILAVVCAGLVALSIVQNIQYNKMLKQQTKTYTEMMIE